MHFPLLALGALIVSVNAFRDTTPFFYYSTEGNIKSSTPLQSATSLSSFINPELQKCSTDFYVLVSQPGVHPADFDGKSSPGLTRAMRQVDKTVKSGYTVNEVIGSIDIEAMRGELEAKCEAVVMKVDASTGSFPLITDRKPRIIEVSFSSPPSSGPSRPAKLQEHDSFLASLLSTLPSSSYTVLYTTTPSSDLPTFITDTSSEYSSPPYEMDSPLTNSLNMELKRDLSLHGLISKRIPNDTLVDGPLFERYGFFSPGLFMGLLVGFLLLTILYVALSGLSSLQVSYTAFDKEMGPKAQAQKQQ